MTKTKTIPGIDYHRAEGRETTEEVGRHLRAEATQVHTKLSCRSLSGRLPALSGAMQQIARV